MLWNFLNTTVGTKANSSEVYTKTQLDARLTNIDDNLNNTYRKNETYNTTETYNKTEVYTKTEVDNRIPSIKIIRLDNGGTGGWFYIGYYRALPFSDVKMEFVGHSYNNDTNATQDAWTTMRFKYGSSTGNFQGNAQAYRFGKQQYAPSDIRIVQSAWR
ncbi:MAG UNVERIFIED_CONTAM: hypothetical protein LVR18_51340 [Planctomycetaceae bacterium]|jgi:hypothetical protein